jgi:hypothetical protein
VEVSENQTLTPEQQAKRERLKEMMKAHVGVQDIQKPVTQQPPAVANFVAPTEADIKNTMSALNADLSVKPTAVLEDSGIKQQASPEAPVVQPAQLDAPVGEQKPTIGQAAEEAMKKTRGRRKKAEETPKEEPVVENKNTCSCDDGPCSFSGPSKEEYLDKFFSNITDALDQIITRRRVLSGRAIKLAEIGATLTDVENNWDSVELIGHAISDVPTDPSNPALISAFDLQADIDSLIAQLDERSAMLAKLIERAIEVEEEKAVNKAKGEERVGGENGEPAATGSEGKI